MIEIQTFEPFKNWMRRNYKFLDEKVVIKTKSSTADYENEIKYQEIKAINRRKISQQNGVWMGFWLIIISSIIISILNATHFNNPTLQLIEPIGTILGMLFCLSIFHTDEFYGFLDKNRNYLGYLIVNKKNRTQVQEALHLIRQKTELFSDATLANPKTKQTALFELSTLDIPDFVNISVTRFYEDRLIDIEKSLTEELVTEIKYSELSGKTQIIHRGNESWNTALGYWIFLWVLVGNFFLVFFPQIFKIWSGIQYLFWGGLLMFVPLYLMRFVKQEAICFYNTNDEVIYWAWISAKNREKIKQIVAFIQQKTGYNPEQP